MILFLTILIFYTVEPNYDFDDVEFLDNYDGDTLKVNIKNTPDIFGKNLLIRLLGIDAPEIKSINQCEKEKSLKVKDYVKAQIAKAKNLKLRSCIRDKYFRLVCNVLLDDKINLNKKLLETKLVVPYDGGTKTKVDWCKN